MVDLFFRYLVRLVNVVAGDSWDIVAYVPVDKSYTTE